MAYTELLDAAIRRTREESDRTRASASGTVCVAISQILSVWCEGSDGYGTGGAALSLRCRVYDSEGSDELLEGKTLLRVALGKTPEPSSFPFFFLLSFRGLFWLLGSLMPMRLWIRLVVAMKAVKLRVL